VISLSVLYGADFTQKLSSEGLMWLPDLPWAGTEIFVTQPLTETQSLSGDTQRGIVKELRFAVNQRW